jgi:hypothetical protein
MQGLKIVKSREARTLRVYVRGPASMEATVAYWRAIAEESRRDRPDYVLLVDELRGPALGAAEWQSLVGTLLGSGLESVRIAHVKPHGLDQVEHCELSARQAGFEARVFVNERLARLWLLFGALPAD